MTPAIRVITTNHDLDKQLHSLTSGDIIACRIRLKRQEEHLLLDLIERGIRLIPSATSQFASRSKCLQARIFSPLMIPHTCVLYDIHGLLETVSLYGKHGIEKVILKHDRKNAGLGIHLFANIEDVYTQGANGVLPFPFVIQPFVQNSRDLRVVILGDYLEAYERTNPHSFRNNLHCGGAATPVELTAAQLELCHTAMKRGNYPYGHLDLMVTESGVSYLAEINLRGGIRGAAITPGEYQQRVKAIEATLLQELLAASAL